MKLNTFIRGVALAGALTVGFTASAMAQSVMFEPYYVTPKLIYSYTKMKDYSQTNTANGNFSGKTSQYNGMFSNDSAWGGGFAAGYDFGAYSEYPIRMELEYLYRGSLSGKGDMQMTANYRPTSDYTNVAAMGTNIQASDLRVEAQVQTLMANFYLDFPTDTSFTPYVGVGIGGAYVNAKIKNNNSAILGYSGYYATDSTCTNTTGPFLSSDPAPVICYAGISGSQLSGQSSGWNAAWQLSAGLSYQIKDNISLDLSYRYSDFGKMDFNNNSHNITGKKIENVYVSGTTDGTNVDAVLGTYSRKATAKLKAHEVIVGLRVSAF